MYCRLVAFPVRHTACIREADVASPGREMGEKAQRAFLITDWRKTMTWTKPEAEVVAVTMEVTAYVATL